MRTSGRCVVLSATAVISTCDAWAPSAITASATFLPVNSSRPSLAAAAAGAVVVAATLRAPLAALCCRPRALPPAFAARLRAGVVRDDELLAPELLRAVDPVRAFDVLARFVPPVLARFVPPVLRDFAAPDADDLRDDDALDVDEELFRDDEPPRLPPVDSAMLFFLL